MNEVFAIFDSEGKVVFTKEAAGVAVGDFTPILIEIPEGKRLAGVDTATQQPIFEDVPKSETEILREKIQQQEEAIFELANMLSEVLG